MTGPGALPPVGLPSFPAGVRDFSSCVHNCWQTTANGAQERRDCLDACVRFWGGSHTAPPGGLPPFTPSGPGGTPPFAGGGTLTYPGPGGAPAAGAIAGEPQACHDCGVTNISACLLCFEATALDFMRLAGENLLLIIVLLLGLWLVFRSSERIVIQSTLRRIGNQITGD